MDTNQFANEEKKSNCVYPAGYKVKRITEQTNILRQLFPDIGTADEKLAEQSLPANAEGLFAIPRWQKVAETYNKAVEKILELIKQQRKGKFYNWRKDKLGKHYLRQHERTIAMLKKLSDQQNGNDILVVASQFGFRHRDCSVCRARKMFGASEFGLGAFEIGCMLLTHPKRFISNDNLWIDCAGDEYSLEANDLFDSTPFFYFSRNDIRFDAYLNSRTSDIHGSASAFISQHSKQNFEV